MHVKLLLVAASVLALHCASADETDTGTGTLTVRVQGLTSNDGLLRFTVFASKKDFLKRPSHSGAGEISNFAGVWTVHNLPFGIYAVLVHHDTNGNNKMERHWYGKPKEPTGTSNNPPPRMGPPKFEDAKFTFDKEEMQILLSVQ